jgi:hypothetical protein
MTEITEEEFEKDFDNIMERIKNDREEFLIRRADGSAVAAVPVDEEIQKILDIMPDIEYDDEVPGEPSF